MDSHPLATSTPLMTSLNLENVLHLKFEVDTAASHNVISLDNYNKLQSCLLKRKRQGLKPFPQGVKIRLADGSLASQKCQVVQIRLSRNLRHFKDYVTVTFLVVKGPNNLIGRFSIEKLWPHEFNALKHITGANVCKAQAQGTFTLPEYVSKNSNKKHVSKQ